ncbi:MAG TPA: SDR family NAD(P)-dependent oxidoreductase [Solirubrobacteraceae bacterium]|nr:SDR family NAD(P)-dependent oxidoreductase [Solirubrobacteraceae bacterium]
MHISGSRVLLTGATGGIGNALARALHARGAELILTGRRREVLDLLAAELAGASVIVADLAEPAEPERLAAAAGRVDILVANAGLPGTGRLDSYTMAEIDRALNVNLRAPIALAHALSPAMIERAHGHLAFMGSLNSKAATPRTCVYNATKFGLRGFAAALRADLRQSGVGVSCIFPGFIRDAGIFADSGARLPPGVGTRSPQDVADALVGAIERNRGEVDVAPLPLRLGAAFAGLAPDLATSVSRRMGAEKVAGDLAAGSVAKR